MPMYGGGAWRGDAVGEYVDFGDGAAGSPFNFTTGAFTVMGSFRMGDLTGSVMLLGRGTTNTSGWMVNTYVSGANTIIRFQTNQAGAQQNTDSIAITTANLLNKWVDVAVTRSGAVAKIYLNGIDITGAAPGVHINPASHAVSMRTGTDWNATGLFSLTAVDNLRIFNTNLTQAQIINEMASPAPFLLSSCVGAWTFDDCVSLSGHTGTTVTALVGAYNGTITGVASNRQPNWVRVIRPGSHWAVFNTGSSAHQIDTAVATQVNLTNANWFVPVALTYSRTTPMRGSGKVLGTWKSQAILVTAGAGTLQQYLAIDGTIMSVNGSARLSTLADNVNVAGSCGAELAENSLVRTEMYALVNVRTTDVYNVGAARGYVLWA